MQTLTPPGRPRGHRARDASVLASGTLVLLDVEAPDLDACMETLLESLLKHATPTPERRLELRKIADEFSDGAAPEITGGAAIFHRQLTTDGPDHDVLVRLSHPLHRVGRDGEPVRFVWVLLCRSATHPYLDRVVEFAHLVAEEPGHTTFLTAQTAHDLERAYVAARDNAVRLRTVAPTELRATGRPFGALMADVRRRLPHYLGDWTDGFNTKSLASTVFLFFACLAPSVAFGGRLSLMTNGDIGVVETLLATSITGIVYAIFSGQPLALLGSTGPVTVFLGILWGLARALGVDYLPALSWVGLWTALFLVILVAVDAGSWIRLFTRFTDDTFAALISLIFVYEAVSDVVSGFTDPNVSEASALFAMVLAVGTFLVASQLSRFRRSVYLRRSVREFLADFGPTIAIVLLAGAAYWHAAVPVARLPAPEEFGTTSGRAWFVNPLDAPVWIWGAAAIPALLGAILVYLDQNITARLVNNRGNKLTKGGGYHLDMLVVAGLIAAFSFVGLPWTVAATVRSLNHVRSLAVVGPGDRITSVTETRLTGFTIHLLIGCTLLLLPALELIPMSVLFGLFLFMGIGSMQGNQFFERIRLTVMDPALLPTTSYLRAVPRKITHRYTAIQAVGLALLWFVKTGPAALAVLFPLFIAMLIPIRLMLGRFFKPEHLALLDAEELPDEEAYRETD